MQKLAFKVKVKKADIETYAISAVLHTLKYLQNTFWHKCEWQSQYIPAVFSHYDNLNTLKSLV
jgi:hypothetical protein